MVVTLRLFSSDLQTWLGWDVANSRRKGVNGTYPLQHCVLAVPWRFVELHWYVQQPEHVEKWNSEFTRVETLWPISGMLVPLWSLDAFVSLRLIATTALTAGMQSSRSWLFADGRNEQAISKALTKTLSITLRRTPHQRLRQTLIKYAPELDDNKVKADKSNVLQPV